MIKFWNGNKSPARQVYESSVLQLSLEKTGWGRGVVTDNTDYPCADDEGNILENGADILATIAGNKKFSGKRFLEVKAPICKGLMGRRLMIVKKSREVEFGALSLEQLKQMRVGVPNTWVDAELFRHNGFNVLERGSLGDMLGWLIDETVDFITLGATEAHDVIDQFPALKPHLAVESTMSIYYPFPVVFYISADNVKLAAAVEQGLNLASEDKSFDALFEANFGDILSSVALQQRTTFKLENPLLPSYYTLLLDENL